MCLETYHVLLYPEINCGGTVGQEWGLFFLQHSVIGAKCGNLYGMTLGPCQAKHSSHDPGTVNKKVTSHIHVLQASSVNLCAFLHDHPWSRPRRYSPALDEAMQR